MKRDNKKNKKRKRKKSKLIKRKKRDIYLKRTFKRGDLKTKLSLLPNDIQKKIYIYAFKLFWRDYIPLTAKIPSWVKHKNLVEKTLWNAKLKNIHFLHLPFNIIPENKTWIMGCQCRFCSKIKYKYKKKEYNKLAEDFTYFYEIMPGYDPACIKYLEDYDPYCGSAYEDQDKYELRNNKKTKFDNAIINYYI